MWVTQRRRSTAILGAVAAALLFASSGSGCAARGRADIQLTREQRVDAIRRASVWRATNIRAMDVRRGPRDVGGFPFNAVVECTYVARDMNGRTPKFTCALPNGDEVKVKYGLTNGEVYAEVAATRLLWALGFGADAMFPVRIRCHDCPQSVSDVDIDPTRREARGRGLVELDYAAIERKLPAVELADSDGGGWSWSELHYLPAQRSNEALAPRDALTLLAALLQHTDSKREQQRLVCLDGTRRQGEARLSPGDCARPFMLISDLGKTFGRANAFNRNIPGSVNLAAWRSVPVWLDDDSCRANLSRSATGTLENPRISEEGRRFLTRLLQQLTDRQLHDLRCVVAVVRKDEGFQRLVSVLAAFDQ